VSSLRNHRLLYLFTLGFFLLSLLNIHLAVLGLLCMTLPFYLLLLDGKKTWCQGYCPRSSLYMTLGKHHRSSRKIPRTFTQSEVKYGVLIYFLFSLLIMTFSTLRVARGQMAPMLIPRFLIFIPLPVHLVPLFPFPEVPLWFTHLSFRIFSMMMTTTTLGLILAKLYKPRTWCTICPVNTLSGIYLMKKKGETLR